MASEATRGIQAKAPARTSSINLPSGRDYPADQVGTSPDCSGFSGMVLTFTSPKQSPRAGSDPRASWLEPEGPHSVENIDDRSYGAFRIEFKQP